MTTVILPSVIQTVLEAARADYEDCFHYCLSSADQELTRCLISDATDFVCLDEADCLWLFVYDEQADDWDVYPTSKARYEIDSAMIGDEEIDVEEFAAEVRHNLPGVNVVAVTARKNGANNSTAFVEQFRGKLEAAFDQAMQSM